MESGFIEFKRKWYHPFTTELGYFEILGRNYIVDYAKEINMYIKVIDVVNHDKDNISLMHVRIKKCDIGKFIVGIEEYDKRLDYEHELMHGKKNYVPIFYKWLKVLQSQFKNTQVFLLEDM